MKSFQRLLDAKEELLIFILIFWKTACIPWLADICFHSSFLQRIIAFDLINILYNIYL